MKPCRFLSTSVGVRYLHEIGFIQRELDEWYDVSCPCSTYLLSFAESVSARLQERNAIYVVQLELQLASALHTDQISSDTAKSETFPSIPLSQPLTLTFQIPLQRYTAFPLLRRARQNR